MAGIRSATEEEKVKWRAENPYYEDVNIIDGIPYRKNSDLEEWEKAQTAAYRANPYNEMNYADTANGKNKGYTATPTSTSSSNLKVNEENINSFINQIDTSIDTLNSTWNSIVTTDIETIKNSWASNDATSYIDKLMAEGDKISDIVQALKLLEETYQKVLNESTATGQDVSGSVGRL